MAPAYIGWLIKALGEVGRSDIHLLDCPVSGGTGRAANGTLSIFASGQDSHFDHAYPILECMSSKLYRIPGDLGGGSKVKMIHQIFAGVNIAMASEAMGLAAAAEVNTTEAFETLRDSEGGSWMFGNRVPHMLNPNLPAYSAVTIIAKDVVCARFMIFSNFFAWVFDDLIRRIHVAMVIVSEAFGSSCRDCPSRR